MGTLSARRLCAAILVAAVLGGCVNPFEPADPVPPNVGGVIPNFSTPEKLLDTIAEAISAEGGGELAYSDALADSASNATPFGFYATPDPVALAAWRQASPGRDPYDPGDVRHERLFYPELMTVLDQFDYVFQWSTDPNSELDDINNTAGTALLHRYYVLQATSSDGRIEKIIAVGYADLFLRKYGGRWYLARWDDRIDPTYGVNPTDLYNRSMGWRRLDL
ncbi:MAG: hypothetical protein HZA61_15495 [Candidatus Eisenbacteria bacterium]|uniref:Uncharacterized protein n=1 Tax=Eiseniibacteriota bacterium TaxID=2212470 RepID=A0A933W4C3_UNCEI|nr:hypothetical protein [Candidatus Eisenbacteria bacterium]